MARSSNPAASAASTTNVQTRVTSSSTPGTVRRCSSSIWLKLPFAICLKAANRFHLCWINVEDSIETGQAEYLFYTLGHTGQPQIAARCPVCFFEGADQFTQPGAAHIFHAA